MTVAWRGLLVAIAALLCAPPSWSNDAVQGLLDTAEAERTATPAPAAAAPSGPATVDLAHLDELRHEFNVIRDNNKLYECTVLTIGGLISLLLILAYFDRRPDSESIDVVSAIGIVVIVFGTLSLVILVDVDEQLTAATGILGAIAGYLFGSSRRPERGAPTPSRTSAAATAAPAADKEALDRA